MFGMSFLKALTIASRYLSQPDFRLGFGEGFPELFGCANGQKFRLYYTDPVADSLGFVKIMGVEENGPALLLELPG